jgi:hypothetical protein
MTHLTSQDHDRSVAFWPIRNRPGGLPDSLARLLGGRALFDRY